MILRRVLTASAVLGALSAVSSVAHAADPMVDSKSFYELIDEDDPHPRNWDFAFLSVGANQNWGLAHWKGGGFYFGAGGGAGPPLYRISSMEGRDVGIDPFLEILFGNVYFRIAPFKYLDFDVGARISLGASLYNVTDPPRAGFVRGGYADLRVGSKKVKFGPRFEYDSIVYDKFNETGWIITPVMMRLAM